MLVNGSQPLVSIKLRSRSQFWIDYNFNSIKFSLEFQPQSFQPSLSSSLHMPDVIECLLWSGSHWPWASWELSTRAWKSIHWIWVQTMPAHWWLWLMESVHWPALQHQHSLDSWHQTYVKIIPYLFAHSLISWNLFHLQSALEEWRFVFWVTFGIFLITTVIYSIWASGEVQPWNFPQECRSSEFGHKMTENNNSTEKQFERGDNKLWNGTNEWLMLSEP